MTAADLQDFDATRELPEGTLLLEASAGTGKTYTITSLVLRAVAELGIELDRLLVVTFTRAAAAELRGRIRSRLAAAVRAVGGAADMAGAGAEVDVPALAGDDAIVAHLIDGVPSDELTRRADRLRRAAENFDQATIDTIHGFCRAALHRAAPDVVVELDLELAEDVTELIDELVHDVLVRELRGADEDWYRRLTSGGVRPARLREIARRLEAEPHLQVLPAFSDLHEVEPRERWDATLDGFVQAWCAQRDELEAWVRDHVTTNTKSTAYKGKNLTNRLDAVDAWCAAAPPDRDPARVATQVKWFARSKLEEHGDGASIPSHLDVVDHAERLLAAPVDAPARVLARFARTVVEELPRRKAQRGILSFGDLLDRLAEALDDEATAATVRAGIRSRFSMALIDEFQDTDAVQWRIFDRVFGEDARLQLIGDPKQAIYAFRGADVGTYLEVVDDVPLDRRFTLRTNFRSDARYLAAVGQLFSREAFAPEGAFGVDRIRYVPVEATERHHEDRLRFEDDPRPRLDIRYVPRELTVEDENDPPPDVITKGWAGQFLTRCVVHEIVEVLEEGPTLQPDGEPPRPVAPGDLAVLVRTNRQAQRMQAALLDAGVPAVVESDASVVESPEATAVQRLLDALLRPSSERVVRPALLGPLLGVDPADLDRADDDTWDTWAEDLTRWATLWREQGVAVALRRIMEDRGAAAATLQRLRGERTLTNLLHLRELLHRAEVTERLGPEGLAAWLREQRHAEAARAEDRELRLESDADAVTVVTIHRAKGLQYGLVWCPFLWEGRRLMGESAAILRYRDPETERLSLDVAPMSEEKAPAKRIAEREAWEESLRLLYVALTRAEHRCVVYTGPFTSSGASPLARLLHAARPGDGGELPPDPKDRPDEDLFAELQALASDEVGVSQVAPPPPPRRWSPTAGARSELATRTFDRGLDLAWQRTSFSRLTSGEVSPPDGTPRDEGRDHDHEVASEPTDGADGGVLGGRTPVGRDVAATTLPLGRFPRGAEPGTFLHTVFEHLDFRATDAEVVDLVTQRLASSPFAQGDGAQDPARLASAIRAVLRTPLGPLFGDAPLAAIDRLDRLDELDFDLPLAGGYRADGAVTLHRIADVAEAHAGTSTLPLAAFAARLRARPATPVRGFLTGSIDLVARIEGRYLLADYKSNWLGQGDEAALSDYHPQRLGDAMLGHDYLLQASLYLVALHRFLRSRLGQRFDPDRDVAGFAYLFLRGMVGEHTPRAEDGTPYGVFAAAPPVGYVRDLDAVLRGEEP